jgi:hypothetical protein
MSKQRYTPEFKDEAVRQVTEKGHSAHIHFIDFLLEGDLRLYGGMPHPIDAFVAPSHQLGRRDEHREEPRYPAGFS